MASTRKKIFGLGDAVTVEDSVIKGGRLPTTSQVLRSMLYFVEEGAKQNRTKHEAASMVHELVKPFYQKGGIPMLSDKRACAKIVEIMEENIKFRRIPKNRRESASVLEKVNKYETELGKTCPLWAKVIII